MRVILTAGVKQVGPAQQTNDNGRNVFQISGVLTVQKTQYVPKEQEQTFDIPFILKSTTEKQSDFRTKQVSQNAGIFAEGYMEYSQGRPYVIVTEVFKKFTNDFFNRNSSTSVSASNVPYNNPAGQTQMATSMFGQQPQQQYQQPQQQPQQQQYQQPQQQQFQQPQQQAGVFGQGATTNVAGTQVQGFNPQGNPTQQAPPQQQQQQQQGGAGGIAPIDFNQLNGLFG